MRDVGLTRTEASSSADDLAKVRRVRHTYALPHDIEFSGERSESAAGMRSPALDPKEERCVRSSWRRLADPKEETSWRRKKKASPYIA